MKETIKIEGMTCGGCINSIKNALSRLPLENAEVEIGSADVEYDEAKVNYEQIVTVIEDAGFEVATVE